MFGNLKLSAKLLIGFAAVLSMMIFTAVIGVSRVGVIDKTLSTVSQESALKQRYAINFRGSVHDRAISIRDAYMSLDQLSFEEHLAQVNKLNDFYQDSAQKMDELLRNKGANPEERKLLERIVEIEKNTLTVTDKVVELRRTQQLEPALMLLIGEVSPAYSEWLKAINAFIDYQESVINKDVGLVQEVANSFSQVMLFITCIAVVIGISITLLLVRDVNGRLGADPSELQLVAVAVAAGNLDVTIPVVKQNNSVMAAMSSMLKALRNSAELAEQTKIQEAEIARAKAEHIEKERIQAEENQRIKQALDVASTNVMIADAERRVIYINLAMDKAMRDAEPKLRSVSPQFSVEKLIGNPVSLFQPNAHSEAELSDRLERGTIASISVADMHYRLSSNPIYDQNRQKIGTVIEWQDRTAEVNAEKEIADVVSAALNGNFEQKVVETNKTGFLEFMAKGLNQLTETTRASLSDINTVLQAIAQGDLTVRVNSTYLGAFNELKTGCNETADNLSKMLAEIKAAAVTINVASSEISKGNTDLSSRTEQQASSLEETASSMDELTTTVRQNADNARQANSLAAKASCVAVDGGELIEQVVKTMASINDSAQKISDIIGVIDGIAFQTNILALNAAVEAARAGEQGRGFAVVASEVRTLAQRSADAAKDIKALISDSVNKINNGNELVGKSGDTMKEIVKSIKRVNDIMTEIAAASSEQSAGLDEVSKAVSQMDEMTQLNAALVEEAAASAESLLSQAEQLSANVAKFKLDERFTIELQQLQKLKTNVPKPQIKLSAKHSRLTKQVKSQEDEWESF